MVLNDLPKKNIKLIRALKTSKNVRDKNQRFLVEGIRSLEEAIKSDFIIDFAVVSNKFLNQESRSSNLISHLNKLKLFKVSQDIFETISDTVTPQGVMAVIKKKFFELGDNIKENFLVVALDKIKDPGNMGTMIRTADAGGADAIIMNKGCVDVYNPKVVRSTMGSIFHLPLIEAEDMIDVLRNLKERGGQIVTTHLKAKKYYYEVDFKKPTVFVMGKEDEGVSEEIVDMSDDVVRIPMPGSAESLNVSVAEGIILFEAVKQRLDARSMTDA